MAIEVVVDARKLGDSGIGVYLENLVSGLLELPQYRSGSFALILLVEPRFLLLSQGRVTSGGNDDRLTSPGTNAAQNHNLCRLREKWSGRVRFVEESAGKYSFAEFLCLGLRQRKLLAGCQIFHCPHYTLPFFLPIKTIVTVHDVIHYTHPQSVWHRWLGGLLIGAAVRRATRVLTVSEASARALKKYFSVPESRLRVVPNSLRYGFVSESEPGSSAGQQGQPYYLFVGSDKPHKGLGVLLDVWADLLCSGGSDRCRQLICVGKSYSEKLRNLVSDRGLAGQISFVGEVSQTKLVDLYRGCAALVMPSFEEGFGLPALEAMVLGVPVIAFPVDSLAEICGEAGWFAKAFTAKSFGETISEFEANPDLVKVRREEGIKRASGFTTELFAKGIHSVYEEVLSETSGKRV